MIFILFQASFQGIESSCALLASSNRKCIRFILCLECMIAKELFSRHQGLVFHVDIACLAIDLLMHFLNFAEK